jgi:hypothetical protein
VIRPRLFVSYARDDRVAADRLVQHLQSRGCAVWIDRNELLAGDDFVRALTRELARCDALILLLTAHSARSSWCQAEVQHALARRLGVVVVQRESQARLPDAMERLLRDIQRVSWMDGTPDLASQLVRARRRRLHSWLTRLGATCAATGVLIGAAWWGVAQINKFDEARLVDSLLNELATSTTAWSGEEIRSRLQPVRAAPALAAGLHAMFDDPTRNALARTNAWQALGALRQERERERRTYVPRIDWRGGRLADMLWANTTYSEGNVRDLIAERVRIAGLVFGEAPRADRPGMSLESVRIRDAEIWFLRIDGTQLIDVEFVNAKLRGAQLDLSGAAGVRFVSKAQSEFFLSNDLAIIEDSWIAQHRAPASPGVIDLTQPEQEVIFEGVQFVRVRFEGFFKPSWFRNSRFTDCVFATDLSAEGLARNGNQSEGSMFVQRR